MRMGILARLFRQQTPSDQRNVGTQRTKESAEESFKSRNCSGSASVRAHAGSHATRAVKWEPAQPDLRIWRQLTIPAALPWQLVSPFGPGEKPILKSSTTFTVKSPAPEKGTPCYTP